MVDIDEAKKIIEEKQPYPVKRIRDVGNTWVLTVDTGLPIIPPGIPLYGVEKESGAVSNIKPIKSIELSNTIANAPIVWEKG